MIYQFADCALDCSLRQLTVDGKPVHVEPQVFDVLRHLIENRDTVVSRDELIEAVWHGRIVSETTISARIWAARHAVGDTGEAQAVIRTVPRRGFHFVAPVYVDEGRSNASFSPRQGSKFQGEDGPSELDRPPEPERAASVHNAGWLAHFRVRFALAAATVMLLGLVAGLVGLERPWDARPQTASVERMAFPLPDKPSIAVLPFANLSSDAARHFMGEGLTESLVNALAVNPLLFVISHSSTSLYGDRSVAAHEVAEELGVRYILEGSVRRSDGQVRVMAQLVDTLGGKVLWSERYQRATSDLLALENEITAEIARSLDVRIIYGSDKSSGGTRSLDAWAAYMQGRTEYLKFAADGIARARGHYQRAIEIDPNYAEAMVALAYAQLIEMSGAPQETWPDALASIRHLERQAAEIAPRMPRLLELRSLLSLSRGDHDEALAHAEAMVELDPNGAESHYALGRMFFFTGQYDRAIDSLSTAMRINPHSSAAYAGHLAFSHLALGRTDQAVSILETVTERFPNYSPGHAYLAIAYQLAGRDAEARRQAAALPGIAPDIKLEAIKLRFSPLQDRQVADRILAAGQQAGIAN
jgi:TolB-like protein/DNA-binding winged helix-turn-helix (wHTH) protein/tetratricopeptide (TPR) repeat protein